ncbi:MAG: J domain-containing protein [Candidatus Dadabacteria bacterium]|nr:MAG: J domain-containing protein [Candidatus Dadabacteria bacterium]
MGSSMSVPRIRPPGRARMFSSPSAAACRRMRSLPQRHRARISTWKPPPADRHFDREGSTIMTSQTRQNPVQQLQQLLSKMERLDYYQILGVNADADEADIRKAFYARSRKYHPDRYNYVTDAAFRELVTRVFKQISEAYNMLKDPALRKFYDQALAEDRAANLRMRPQDAQEKAQKKEYDGGSGPGAKYYKLAKQAFVARDMTSARNNIKLALTMEPGNEHFQALQQDIEARS